MTPQAYYRGRWGQAATFASAREQVFPRLHHSHDLRRPIIALYLTFSVDTSIRTLSLVGKFVHHHIIAYMCSLPLFPDIIMDGV